MDSEGDEGFVTGLDDADDVDGEVVGAGEDGAEEEAHDRQQFHRE